MLVSHLFFMKRVFDIFKIPAINLKNISVSKFLDAYKREKKITKTSLVLNNNDLEVI